jgi:sulfate permease, SulP family
VFGLLWEALSRMGEINPHTFGIGVASIAALVAAKKWAPRMPAALGVVILATLATWGFGLHERGVAIVGAVPSGLPVPSLPSLNGGALSALLVTALTISFVGFMESFAVAKSIATREKYGIDANRELKGLGLANLAAGTFSGYPVTGGFSRSAVNYQAGARTGLASIITAGIILVTLMAFTSLFHYLPRAVLAAIIMVAVAGLVDVREVKHLFSVKKIDGWTLFVTFAATLVIGIEIGILVGVAFSLLVFIWRSAYPHSARLGYLARERVFRNVERFPEAGTFGDTVVLRIDASLYFANMSFLDQRLRAALVEDPGCHNIILDFSGVNDMDAVAVDTLGILMGEMKLQGVDVHIAAMKGPVRDVTARAGWKERFGERIGHLSIERALEAVGAEGWVAEGETYATPEVDR